MCGNWSGRLVDYLLGKWTLQGPRCHMINGFLSQALPLSYDSLTFILTAYKSFTYWRLEIKTPMLTIMFRDGLLYFTVIFLYVKYHDANLFGS